MARHRDTRKRGGIVARSRRPALLGGALGGGAALVIGITACAVLSTTNVGVHFTFVDRAEAAVVGSRNYEPAVTRDLATAPSATPTPTPTSTPHATAAAQAAAAAKSAAKAAAQQAEAGQVSAATASPAPAAEAPAAPATAAAAPSPTPTSSPSDSAASTPAQTSAPVAPTPQPTDGGDGCLLLIICP
jgi:hypothetical protein